MENSSSSADSVGKFRVGDIIIDTRTPETNFGIHGWCPFIVERIDENGYHGIGYFNSKKNLAVIDFGQERFYTKIGHN